MDHHHCGEHAGLVLGSLSGYCGCMAQVVYVPVPVLRTESCRNCHRNQMGCLTCNRVRNECNDANNVHECQCVTLARRSLDQSDARTSDSESVFRTQPSDEYDQNTIRTQCMRTSTSNPHLLSVNCPRTQPTSSPTCEHNNNNVVGGMALCSGGHLMSVMDNRNLMLCPSILPACCAHVNRVGTAVAAPSTNCQVCSKSERSSPQDTSASTDERINENQKMTDNEGPSSSKTHRRLSADSGRVTWSDSGESVFSDFQFGDTLHRASTTTTRTSVTTSQCQFSLTPTIQTFSRMRLPSAPAGDKMKTRASSNTDLRGSRQRSGSGGEASIFIGAMMQQRSISNNADLKRTKLNESPSADGPALSPRPLDNNTFTFKSPSSTTSINRDRKTDRATYIKDRSNRTRRARDEHLRARGSSSPSLVFEENASLNGEKRSVSEHTLQSRSRSVGFRHARGSRFSPVGPRLGQVDENRTTPPRRPRSKSLFMPPEGSVQFSISSETMSPLIQEMETMRVNEKPDTINFTSWNSVKSTKEIGGIPGSKDDIKAYGITALPSLGGFAVTDADKVKIKIYGLNGEMKSSFGTPTWPRYGRGITLAPNKNTIAVCHLSEVCTYTLEGVSKDRFAHEKFTACWGIVCDNKGNYVITDPKSSSIYILSPSGEIRNQIGGNITAKNISQKQMNSRSRISWKKSNKKQGGSVSERNMTDSVRCLSNMSLPIAGMEDNRKQSTSSAIGGKKQVRLLAPRYVAVNSKNQILVSDTRQRCLLVFEEDGTMLFSIGGGRTGCEKCSYGRNRRDERIMERTLYSASQEKIICWKDSVENNIDMSFISPLRQRKLSLSPLKKADRAKSHSFLTDICSSNALCAVKHERVRVLGTIYRGNVGRNESVESQEYVAAQKRDPEEKNEIILEENKVNNQHKCSPSHSVGSRLHSHGNQVMIDQCSSYIELSDGRGMEQDGQRSKRYSPSVLSKIAKNIGKPLWHRRRKKAKKVITSQVARCESIGSLSEDEIVLSEKKETQDGGNASSQLKRIRETEWQRASFSPGTNITTFTYGSSEKKSSSDAISPSEQTVSPKHGRNTSEGEGCSDDNLNDYSIISFASTPEHEYENESDDEERMACRRCHVEDPRGICVDEEDNILLVDRARNRVTVFTPEGHFVRHILTEENGLNEPMAVCVLHDGSLAVTDSSNCVKVFRFN